MVRSGWVGESRRHSEAASRGKRGRWFIELDNGEVRYFRTKKAAQQALMEKAARWR